MNNPNDTTQNCDNVTNDEQCQNKGDPESIQIHTKFEDFDEIVVRKILSFLSSSERRQKRLVCSYWKYLLDFVVGLETLINVLNRPLMEFCSKRVLTTIRIKRLTSNGINNNYFPHIKPSSWLTFPHRLRTLILEQYINFDYLQQILTKCSKLVHIKLILNNLNSSNNNCLQQVDYSLWKNQIHLNLKSLQIHHQIPKSNSISNLNYNLISQILKLEAPTLDNLSLHFQLNNSNMDTDILINLQMTIIKFLQNHSNLNYLSVDFKGQTTLFASPQYLIQTYQNQHGFDLQDFTKISKSFKKLENLVIRLPKSCGCDFWTLLYRQQIKLTKLVVQLPDIKLQSLIPIVQQNSKTLVIVSLCADTDDQVTLIDFTAIKECTKLRNLHIEVLYKEDRSLTSQTIHLPFLPNNLERLDIGWISMSTQHIENILKLTQLKYLALVGCGEHDQFGVTIPILCDLLSNRNLEQLFVFNINHQYLQFFMRRLVNILHHLQRHNVRVHVRERALYCGLEWGKKSGSACQWLWGSYVSQNWTRPPAIFVNKYVADEKLNIIL